MSTFRTCAPTVAALLLLLACAACVALAFWGLWPLDLAGWAGIR